MSIWGNESVDGRFLSAHVSSCQRTGKKKSPWRLSVKGDWKRWVNVPVSPFLWAQLPATLLCRVPWRPGPIAHCPSPHLPSLISVHPVLAFLPCHPSSLALLFLDSPFLLLALESSTQAVCWGSPSEDRLLIHFMGIFSIDRG